MLVRVVPGAEAALVAASEDGSRGVEAAARRRPRCSSAEAACGAAGGLCHAQRQRRIQAVKEASVKWGPCARGRPCARGEAVREVDAAREVEAAGREAADTGGGEASCRRRQLARGRQGRRRRGG